MDCSWRHDGSLYPGVAELHRQLRGKAFAHSTVLTARPPSLCQSLPQKLSKLATTHDGVRMGILPGATGMAMASNAGAIMAVGKFANHHRRNSGGLGIEGRQQYLANI